MCFEGVLSREGSEESRIRRGQKVNNNVVLTEDQLWCGPVRKL